MSQSETAFSGTTYWVCPCCDQHDDLRLTGPTVTCEYCGNPCNCEGCVAEGDSA